MPYKSEKIQIQGSTYDRRRKLDDGDRAQILVLREQDGMSFNKIAKMFGVSKRLIQFICCPLKEEKCKAQFKERRKDGRYYNKEDNTNSVRATRRYKQVLYKEGKI